MENTVQTPPLDFSFLDQTEFRSKYTIGSSDSIRFYIEGIRCGKCVRKLEELPLSVPGLKQLQVELSKNLAYAQVDPAVLTFSDLAHKIKSLGFNPIPLSSQNSELEAQKKEDRSDLIRLGVAAFCAGNIMTFSFATYFGDTGEFYGLFTWLSFLIYLPVVTYVALPFYRGAWKSIRHKQISIDLPMAVASISGFIYSAFELLHGGKNIYFDSLSGFLFLILVSRWAQKKLQRHYLRAGELKDSLQLEKVRVVRNHGWRWAPLSDLMTGSHILLRRHETLPADAELLSENAFFSMAWSSGELKAKTFLKGAEVGAGARLESNECELRILRSFDSTAFGNILREIQKFSLSQNRLISEGDRWSQWLLGTVFSAALLFLLYYWHISPDEAIRRSMALIVLACPCAMAFGTPLALSAALKKSQRLGLIVRNANVFENLQSVKTIYFDKTGTLTETDLTLKHAGYVPSKYRDIILALENGSLHPIAFAFRKAFSAPKNPLFITQLKENPGTGVSGFYDGRFYEIKAASGKAEFINCELFEDGISLFKFGFDAGLKPECRIVLDELRNRGYLVALLSGDKKESVMNLSHQLGFTDSEIFYEMTPPQKEKIVRETTGAMMIGDGVNDSPALMKALVGVAASGGVEAALKSSDVYLTGENLTQLLSLFDLSKKAMNLVRANLKISVLYNAIGGTLALLGFVNPLVAALLMPVSSGFILLNTWWRSR